MGPVEFKTGTNRTQEVDADHGLPVEVVAGIVLPVADVEIGAVELKDGTSDTRAKIGAGNAAGAADNAVTVADANALAKLEALRLLLVSLGANTDGIEALLTAIGANTDGVETALALLATEANLTALRNQFPTASGDDVAAGTAVGQVFAKNTVYDATGNAWQRMRDVLSSQGTSGKGILGAGLLGWDTAASLFKRLLIDSGGRLTIAGRGGLTDGNTNAPTALANEGNSNGSPIGASVFNYSGVGHVRAREVNILKTAQGSVANGADLTLWTPTSGKKFRLRGLRCRSSVTGRYEARDATGTVIAYFYLTADVWTTVLFMDVNGYLSAAANNALLIRNQAGGTANMDATADGNEE